MSLEGLDPGARKENEGIQGQLVMGRKGRKENMVLEDLREIEAIGALQVRMKEGQCTLAGDETPVPVCLAQRLYTKAMLLGPSTPPEGEGQTCSACQKDQSILPIILESMVIAL